MIPFIQLVSSTSVSSCPYSQQRLHNNRSRMGAATRGAVDGGRRILVGFLPRYNDFGS
jgi:hypothetical protein